jgi:hypothetical protein
MKKLSALLFVCFLAFSAVYMPHVSFAQEVANAVNQGSNDPVVVIAAEDTKVDLSKVVSSVDSIFGALLAFVALGLYTLLSKIPFFNKLVTKEQYQKLIDPLLDEAVAFGVGKLTNADWLKLDTKNEAIAHAVNYAIDHGGELLAKFGITEKSLREKLEAKLVANGWDVHPGKWDEPTQA